MPDTLDEHYDRVVTAIADYSSSEVFCDAACRAS